MDVPVEAIEAAAKAWHENGPAPASWEAASDSWKHGGLLRMEKSLEAAMPAIREAIAQEIEAKITKPKNIWDDDGHYRQHNFKEAARIVRGSTP